MCPSNLLQGHAPHTVLPAAVRASGAQTEGTVGEGVAGRRAWQRRRGFHLHGRDVEEGVAEAGPVIRGVDAQDTPCLAW